jgi:hypothetical protein
MITFNGTVNLGFNINGKQTRPASTNSRQLKEENILE